MKNIRNIVVVLLVLCLILCACGKEPTPTQTPTSSKPAQTVDYAGSIKLNMSTDTIKQEVTVKTFVDGDTVHFNVPEYVMANGVLKARFLAINTPESTGKIEQYGKKASQFTKEKLSNATSIIVETESNVWDPDSTGSRYLVWIWYKTADMADYRNLNVEILQNGLAIANNSAQNRYGSTCMSALNQAKAQKLNIYSGVNDPDFYYGDAVELTLKELRTNIEAYSNMKVAFNGVVVSNSGTQGVYVEDYDAETGMYYGIYVYYGHNLSGVGLDILSVGNEVRIVGSVQYYEGGGTWQVSDLNYRLMKPNDPGNIQKLGDGKTPAYTLTDVDKFVNGKVTIETEEESKEFNYSQLAMATSVEMKGLKVVDIYTTDNEDSSSNGAMTLTCEKDGETVTVRTTVFLDENGKLITEEYYSGKTIDVKGIVDYYSGTYQVKVFTPDNITINK